MSLQGLPPLPKSLSGFADGEPDLTEPPPAPAPSDDTPPTDLDSQLVYLKKEMVSLVEIHTSPSLPFSYCDVIREIVGITLYYILVFV